MNNEPKKLGVLATYHLICEMKGANLFIMKVRPFSTQKLRRHRNKAARMEDFELKNMPIEAYIDIALTLASGLERYEP